MFYATGLSVVGLDAGIVVGVTAGLTSFIPYVGAVFGVALGLAMGLGQFGADYVMLAQIAGVFVLGQFLEGNVLTPRLVGDRVRLHPVWIIFACSQWGIYSALSACCWQFPLRPPPVCWCVMP